MDNQNCSSHRSQSTSFLHELTNGDSSDNYPDYHSTQGHVAIYSDYATPDCSRQPLHSGSHYPVPGAVVHYGSEGNHYQYMDYPDYSSPKPGQSLSYNVTNRPWRQDNNVSQQYDIQQSVHGQSGPVWNNQQASFYHQQADHTIYSNQPSTHSYGGNSLPEKTSHYYVQQSSRPHESHISSQEVYSAPGVNSADIVLPDTSISVHGKGSMMHPAGTTMSSSRPHTSHNLNTSLHKPLPSTSHATPSNHPATLCRPQVSSPNPYGGNSQMPHHVNSISTAQSQPISVAPYPPTSPHPAHYAHVQSTGHHSGQVTVRPVSYPIQMANESSRTVVSPIPASQAPGTYSNTTSGNISESANYLVGRVPQSLTSLPPTLLSHADPRQANFSHSSRSQSPAVSHHKLGYSQHISQAQPSSASSSDSPYRPYQDVTGSVQGQITQSSLPNQQPYPDPNSSINSTVVTNKQIALTQSGPYSHALYETSTAPLQQSVPSNIPPFSPFPQNADPCSPPTKPISTPIASCPAPTISRQSGTYTPPAQTNVHSQRYPVTGPTSHGYSASSTLQTIPRSAETNVCITTSVASLVLPSTSGYLPAADLRSNTSPNSSSNISLVQSTPVSLS
ncbi:unnamed protein product [Protopolystoma xenopodis]|uniref:Uncharacterized protein n=1 Tax=Protopolystoma xenopodis TaxID=117903 RepID=A0A448WUI9_9PLAT|nr:unnamed protein product [Protopolystoma xenopodis]